ncbi:MAG: DUF1453 family protein [Caulobacter sp.]|nr:DUF1453 family protein [Caulobacter sp.]
MTPSDGQAWGPVIGIAVAAIVILIRMRGGAPRPLAMATMWIIPALLVIGFVAMTVTAHLAAGDFVWIALGLAAGSALGWQRGRMMAIHIDAETGRPMVRTSPAALVFILALMALRLGVRQLMETGAVAWHINPLLITDAFLAFAVGLLGVSRLEMFLRARRLASEQASAGKIVA